MRRGYEIAAFAVTTAYVPWFADAAGAPRWILLSLLVPSFVRARTVTLPHVMGLLILGWAAWSLTFATVPLEGLQTLWQFALLAAVFCTGFEMETLEPVFVGAGFGIALSGLVALGQVIDGHQPTGLFLNKNFMAEAALVITIGLLVYRRTGIALLCVPALLVPQSRAVLLALLVVGAIALWRHRLRWTMAIMLGCIAWALALHGLDLRSAGERAMIWGSTIQHLTLLGHGLGSFYIDFPSWGDFGQRFNHTHNDWLEIAYELGVIGVALFGALVVGAMRQAGGGMRYVLAGFLVIGCFGFPLYLPVTGVLAALCLGHLWAVWYRLHLAVFMRECGLCNRPRQFGLQHRIVSPAARGGSVSA